MSNINSFISFSDVHIGIKRKTRHDDYRKILFDSIEYMYKYWNDTDSDHIFINGDLFDKDSVSNEDVNDFLDLTSSYNITKDKMSIIYGNHCLKYNTIEMVKKSSIYVVEKYFSGDNSEVAKWHFGMDVSLVPKDKKFVQIHQYCDENNYKSFFELFPNSKYLLIGDNHICQEYKNKKQVLLNSGHVIRNKKNEGIPYFFYVNDSENIIKKEQLLDIAENSFDNSKNKIENILNINSSEKLIFEKEENETYEEYMLNKMTDEYKEFFNTDMGVFNEH